MVTLTFPDGASREYEAGTTAMQVAQERGIDFVLIDTAGRLAVPVSSECWRSIRAQFQVLRNGDAIPLLV